MLKEEFWHVYDMRDSKARALSFADWHVFNICNSRVILCEKDNFGSDHLKNQLFGPKQVSYTPLGASGPFLTLEGHFSVKIGNFWFLGLSGTQNFK